MFVKNLTPCKIGTGAVCTFPPFRREKGERMGHGGLWGLRFCEDGGVRFVLSHPGGKERVQDGAPMVVLIDALREANVQGCLGVFRRRFAIPSKLVNHLRAILIQLGQGLCAWVL